MKAGAGMGTIRESPLRVLTIGNGGRTTLPLRFLTKDFLFCNTSIILSLRTSDRGAPRSESPISMIAGGNHTLIKVTGVAIRSPVVKRMRIPTPAKLARNDNKA